MTEDEMTVWHQWLNGHEFEQASGVGNGQGSLGAAIHGVTDSDATVRLNWPEVLLIKTRLEYNLLVCFRKTKFLTYCISFFNPDFILYMDFISLNSLFFLLIFPTYYFVSFLAKIQNYSWITWYACDERKKTVFCNQKI